MYTVYSMVLFLTVWYIVGLSFIVVGTYFKSDGHTRHTDKLIWESLSLKYKFIVIVSAPILPLLWPIFVQENIVDIIKDDNLKKMRLDKLSSYEDKEVQESLNRLDKTINEIKKINNIIQ